MTIRFLFAPGAGAPSSSTWMTSWTERLRNLAPVELLDYPYQTRGSKRPDPLPTLIAHHRAKLETLLEREKARVVLIGKSMGSRVGLHVAKEKENDRGVAGAICFGYPLVGTNGKLRDVALVECPCPVLLFQGTRDPLSPLDVLDSVLGKRSFPTELVVVPGGDHDLKCTKTALKERGLSAEESNQAIFVAIERFIARVATT